MTIFNGKLKIWWAIGYWVKKRLFYVMPNVKFPDYFYNLIVKIASLVWQDGGLLDTAVKPCLFCFKQGKYCPHTFMGNDMKSILRLNFSNFCQFLHLLTYFGRVKYYCDKSRKDKIVQVFFTKHVFSFNVVIRVQSKIRPVQNRLQRLWLNVEIIQNAALKLGYLDLPLKGWCLKCF